MTCVDITAPAARSIVLRAPDVATSHRARRWTRVRRNWWRWIAVAVDGPGGVGVAHLLRDVHDELQRDEASGRSDRDGVKVHTGSHRNYCHISCQ